jgi:hypothetical protein
VPWLPLDPVAAIPDAAGLHFGPNDWCVEVKYQDPLGRRTGPHHGSYSTTGCQFVQGKVHIG